MYNLHETGRPLKCWIKDGKVILVLSKTVLIYDYANLAGGKLEIKLSTLLPEISFASTTSLTKSTSGPGELVFWLGAVGPRRRMSTLEHKRKVTGPIK